MDIVGRKLILSTIGTQRVKSKKGNLAKLTFAKNSGSVTREREKNWPIADHCVPSNNPRKNCAAVPFPFLKWRMC